MLLSSFIFFSLRAVFLVFLLRNQLNSLGCHEWHHFIIRQRKTWHAIHIGSYLVGLIENIDAEHDLRFRAETDATTGLSSHTATQDLVASALADASVRRHSVCVALDIDDFKQVNDRYGHLSGDTVLADVGQHLCGALRKGDLSCRWGGDEFVVYCEDMERDDIERRLVELSEGPWNATLPDNRVIELSVSTGIAMVPQDGIAFKTVYERADRALYRAKSKGKAHFCFFEADKDS